MEKVLYFRNQPIEEWEIDIFISHKPADALPSWPYNGLVPITRPPKYTHGTCKANKNQS